MKLLWRVIKQANKLQVKTFDRFKLGIGRALRYICMSLELPSNRKEKNQMNEITSDLHHTFHDPKKTL